MRNGLLFLSVKNCGGVPAASLGLRAGQRALRPPTKKTIPSPMFAQQN
jgi:hypothetical protein